jgi:glycosyltransferase involved in cell wall biosynthesis
LLVDKSLDFTNILSKIKDKPKVISLDIFSHDELLKQGINHEKLENYLDKNDEELIDKLMLLKSHEWYTQKEISNLLQFENMNLGWLLELEITPYFLRILKNFLGIIRIIDKENPLTIISSDFLISMARSIIKDKKIKLESHSSLKSDGLSFDRVEIPIRLGKKTFSFWVSRNHALKIKSFIEYVTNFILNFNHNPKKESIVLLDFNPMLYNKFIQELSGINKEIILLNERRPAIWNYQSLKIVKNSNVKILQLKNFLNKKIKLTILKRQNELDINLQKFFESSIHEDFFSVEGYSFWPSIKEHFISICSERFNEAIERFELSKELFSKLNISSLLTLFPSAPEEKMIIHSAQKFEISGIVLQHGLNPQSSHMDRFLTLFPYVPPTGMKYAAWGTEFKNYLCKTGVNDEDIILSGNPKYDEFFQIKNICKNNGTILLALSILTALEYSGINTKVFEQFKKILEDVCTITTKIPNKELIVKLHPGQSTSYDIKSIIYGVKPSTPIYKNINILDLMKNCDVLVSIGPSTVLLEAMILEKPTITYPIEPQWWYEDKIFQSGATIVVKTPQEFEDAINKILFDEQFRNSLIQKGKKFVNQYLANHENSSKFLATILEK